MCEIRNAFVFKKKLNFQRKSIYQYIFKDEVLKPRETNKKKKLQGSSLIVKVSFSSLTFLFCFWCMGRTMLSNSNSEFQIFFFYLSNKIWVLIISHSRGKSVWYFELLCFLKVKMCLALISPNFFVKTVFSDKVFG